MAIRAFVKLPTGDDTSGASTGKADFAVDAIVSKEINQKVELSGYGGFIVRGVTGRRRDFKRVPLRLRRRFPDTDRRIRITAEVFGEKYFDDQISTRASRRLGS